MTTTQTNQKAWIACPLCGSPTLLHVWPDKLAGIWECTNDQCGASDACEHVSTHTESFTVDTMTNGEHDQYEVLGYVCDDCGEQTEGDPALDAAEDRDDYNPDQ